MVTKTARVFPTRCRSSVPRLSYGARCKAPPGAQGAGISAGRLAEQGGALVLAALHAGRACSPRARPDQRPRPRSPCSPRASSATAHAAARCSPSPSRAHGERSPRESGSVGVDVRAGPCPRTTRSSPRGSRCSFAAGARHREPTLGPTWLHGRSNPRPAGASADSLCSSPPRRSCRAGALPPPAAADAPLPLQRVSSSGWRCGSTYARPIARCSRHREAVAAARVGHGCGAPGRAWPVGRRRGGYGDPERKA